ncbi:MAG: XRE family transcriptional regulator [Lachnospiraceae bacterium]|nr:XRE family transcriptional regulator [Lachnospiraceae bacterium]
MNTTDRLTKVLEQIDRTDKLREYVDDLEESLPYDSFAEYYLSLENVKAIGKAELILRSNIDRTYGYQILNGTRKPGRDKIILLCLVAGLTLAETQRGLKIAGEGILYSRKRRDAILIFAFNEHLSIADTQELLIQFGEAVLE